MSSLENADVAFSVKFQAAEAKEAETVLAPIRTHTHQVTTGEGERRWNMHGPSHVHVMSCDVDVVWSDADVMCASA